MKILADRNMAALEQTFGRHGDVRLFDGRALTRAQLADADVLLVRSVTRVDAALLGRTPVRFVGTATIGTDHLDVTWLERNGIAWASAPGCNADAAAQYTLGMILLAWRRLGRSRPDLRVGIVGHGNVGSRLAALCAALGIPTVSNDPPLQDAGTHGLVALDEALACPVVSLHVPLTRSGRWPTHRLVGHDTLARMPTEALLVNAARGEVVDGAALLGALDARRVHAALDVWPGEPLVEPALLAATTVATPHVAGYSVEGKRRGTERIYDAYLRWLGQPPGEPSGEASGTGTALSLDVEASADPVVDAVVAATRVEEDDRRMRAASMPDAAAFDGLRRAHAPRHEFRHVEVLAPGACAPTLAALGFVVRPGEGSP